MRYLVVLFSPATRYLKEEGTKMDKQERERYIKQTVKEHLDKAAEPRTSNAVGLGHVLLAASLQLLLEESDQDQTHEPTQEIKRHDDLGTQDADGRFTPVIRAFEYQDRAMYGEVDTFEDSALGGCQESKLKDSDRGG